MSQSITEIDKNLKRTQSVEGFVFTPVRATDAKIHGLPEPEISFCRLPERLLGNMSAELLYLQTNTSGVRVRFVTESPRIAVKMTVTNTEGFAHMPYSGYAGLDCYAKNDNGERWIGAAWPNLFESNVSAEFKLSGKPELVTIYLPLYSGVKELMLGVEEGCVIQPPPEYKSPLPIVFYGSSITQGGCASRAANSYPALVCRHIESDFINLGFSGNAKGEGWLSEYIASLPMRAFVYDYDHNAPDVEHLQKTHLPFLQMILAKQPGIPVILMSKPNPNLSCEDYARREIVHKSYEWAKQNGIKAEFIDGDILLGTLGRDSSTVDGVHPNDLGFWRMAEAVRESLLRLI